MKDTPTPATVAHFNLSGGHVWDYRIGVGLASLSSPAFHTARQQGRDPCDTDDRITVPNGTISLC
jgi:hypothetical protein